MITEAENFINEKIPTQKNLYAFIEYLFANFLYRCDYEKESDEYRKKADNFAIEESLVFYIINYQDVPTRRIFTLDFFLQQFLVSLEKLEKESIRQQILKHFQKRIDDSKFLNKLIAASASASTREEYIDVAINELSDYILCKSLYFAQIDEDKIAENASDNENNELLGENSEWLIINQVVRDTNYAPSSEDWKFLIKKSREMKQSFINVKNNIWYYNLSRYDSVVAVIIELDDNRSYTEEDLDVLKIGFSNFQSQLTIISQQEHLRMISSTDQLSNLNNRRALEERLEEESDKIRRYGKTGGQSLVTITFMDLDHFKFYNDTYGHEAGDLLIKSFAMLLKRIYRKSDFISRFGGDEFIIILPSTDSNQAFQATERLRAELEKENHFLNALESELGIKKEIVPKEQYLSFSAGICSNIDTETPDCLVDVRACADKALYYAKEHGRCRTILWRDIQ